MEFFSRFLSGADFAVYRKSKTCCISADFQVSRMPIEASVFNPQTKAQSLKSVRIKRKLDLQSGAPCKAIRIFVRDDFSQSEVPQAYFSQSEVPKHI